MPQQPVGIYTDDAVKITEKENTTKDKTPRTKTLRFDGIQHKGTAPKLQADKEGILRRHGRELKIKDPTKTKREKVTNPCLLFVVQQQRTWCTELVKITCGSLTDVQ